ncbi:DUF1992 domain-containing protein [Blastococcus sp. TF02A-35]|uniref:DnaJ family domain-containing protein n=1 Tax=Blastococcus sp. TF02A-35 TaxID=2559612 RepID=UPI0014315731|nr:DUF1992 domain-containing protein [Blastococcus sp. TF02A_35]
MTERKPPGVSFETWVETQIARAAERGAFENLDGAGHPLPRRNREENAYDWAVAKARREGVDTAAMLPPGLALRRERDELSGRVAHLASEAEVRAVAEDYNARVEAFWRQPQESRWSPVPGLADVEALVSGWRRARPPVLPSPAPEVVEVRAQRRFRRLVARFRRR